MLVYQNTGGGLTWHRVTLATSGTHNARVGDVDGDARTDVVGKNYNASKQVEAWVNMSGGAVGVADTPPAPLTLLGNSPNPFSRNTTIRFRLDEPARVRLSVYDVRGTRVTTLVDGSREAGVHAVSWDGRNDSGRRVGAGAYFYRLRADAASQEPVVRARKLVILK